MAQVRRERHLASSRPVRPRATPGPARRGGQPATRPPRAGPGPGRRQGSGLKAVRRGSTLNLASSGVSAIATTGITIVATRGFSQVVAGSFFTAISMFSILVGVAGLGTNVGLTYFVARLRSLGEERRIPALMRTAIIPVIVASVVAALLLILFASPLAHLVLSGRAVQAGVTPRTVAGALRGLAVLLPFAGLINAYLGASRGYGDMRPTALIGQMGIPVGRLLAVLVAAAIGVSALLAPLWALPYVPATVIAWLWMRRSSRNRARPQTPFPDVPPEVAALLALATPVEPAGAASLATAPAGSPRGSRMSRRRSNARVGSFWAFTAPRAIANVAQNILQSVDVVLVAVLRGPKEAAIYTAATRFLVIGQLGNVAISRASQARFTELFTQGEQRRANGIYQVTTTWLVLLLWPVFLLSVAYGPVVLEVFGRSYRAGGIVMVILGVSMLLATFCGQVDMVLITSGRSSWSLANGLLTMGVNVGLDLILIPRYGITGAAIGWAVAIAVGNLMPLAQLAAVLRLHPFGRGTILACALSALSFGVIPLALHSVLGHGVPSLAVAVAAGSIVQAAGIWRFREALHLPVPRLKALARGRPARAGSPRVRR